MTLQVYPEGDVPGEAPAAVKGPKRPSQGEPPVLGAPDEWRSCMVKKRARLPQSFPPLVCQRSLRLLSHWSIFAEQRDKRR